MNNSLSPDGIYSAMLSFDSVPQLKFVIDSISYDETVFMNAQVDYKYRFNGGAWLQHLSQLPGDNGMVYKIIKGDGVITLEDTDIHSVGIEIKDAYNNFSQLKFAVQRDDSLSTAKIQSYENSYFIPNQVNEIKKPDFEMYLPATTFYDTVQPLYYRNNSFLSYSVSALHQLNDASVPLHNDVSVRIKPDKLMPDGWKDKIVIVRSGRGNNIRKARLEGEWMTAKFGDPGTFQAFADVIAPNINELGRGDTIDLSPSSRILFTPTDNFGIKNFRAELDSQWVRFTNDKSRNWIYKFDERCPYGVHHLKVTVEDLVGNSTTKEWWFRRHPYTPPPKKKHAQHKGGKKTKKESKKKIETRKGKPKKGK
jgi:hypothetical protein